MEKMIKLMHEAGMLSKTPRSGFAFLGAGKQTVAEHSYRVVVIAWMMVEHIEKIGEMTIDKLKLIELCLFHDLPEARTGDLNYVNKRYSSVDQEKIIDDLIEMGPLGVRIAACVQEYDKAESLEAVIAHDADQIELLLVLKELIDDGHERAKKWYDRVFERLHSSFAKELARKILEIPADLGGNRINSKNKIRKIRLSG